MHLLGRVAGAILAIVILSTTSAFADDWVATKLRGKVIQLVDNEWVPLKRNDIVSDDRAVRTLVGGWVTFQRDAETIELGPNTQIRIHDGDGERFTTVEEHFGTVSVEAEVKNVQHFAVQTPFLAAVVKGTKFTVKSGKAGSSVKVMRGAVAVEAVADHSHVIVKAGQTAEVGSDGGASGGSSAGDGGVAGTLALVVSGLGDLPDVLPRDVPLIDDAGNVVGNLLAALVGNNGNHGEGNNGNHGSGGNHGTGNNGNGGGGGSGSGGGGDDDDDDDDDDDGGGLIGGLLGRLL
jgi:hypothetical protein